MVLQFAQAGMDCLEQHQLRFPSAAASGLPIVTLNSQSSGELQLYSSQARQLILPFSTPPLPVDVYKRQSPRRANWGSRELTNFSGDTPCSRSDTATQPKTQIE